MPVAPATIVRTNRSCPGTSTTESRRPSGELERRVAEVDRDPPPLLLRQPVRVLPGQRPDEPRLAVVDVPRGADRQRHVETGSKASQARFRSRLGRSRREHAARSGDLVDLGVGERAAVEERAAVADDRDDRRLAEAERLGEALFDCTGCARQLGERQRPAADARDGLLDVAADEPREPLRPSTNLLDRLVEHPQARESGRASPGRARAESVPSSAASVSLSARSARWSGWRRSRSTSSARPTTIPACGPPRSLSPEKQTRSAPARRLSRRRRLVADARERARAEVVDEREAVLAARPRRAPRAAGAR